MEKVFVTNEVRKAYPEFALDNARFHRMKHLQTLADTAKRNHIILALPPYSPDLNPIEQTWASIKKWLRSHLPKFETIEQGIMEYFGVK